MRVPGADEATDRVASWARRSPWRERQQEVFSAHLGPVADVLEREPAEVGEQLGPLAGQVSVAIFEDFLAAGFGDEEEENVVDAYLARRGWTLGGPAKEFLVGLRNATPSIYEIVEIDRGSTATVRDLVRGGAPIVVSEEMGSQTLALWDCLIARILTVRGTRCFASGLLHCPRELAQHCLADLRLEIKRIRKGLTRIVRGAGGKGAVTEREAQDFYLASPAAGPYFTLQFVVWTVRQKEAFVNSLRNTDGQSLLLSTARFPIEGEEAEVARALDAVAEFDRIPEEEHHWDWPGPESPADTGPRDSPRRDTGADVLRLSLGHLEIANGSLLLHTNSAERAEKGRALVASGLGSLVGKPLTSHEDPLAQLRRMAEDPSFEGPSLAGPLLDGPPADADAAPPPTEGMQALAADYLKDHYRRTLDEPVPMLGNRTPRQAAKDPERASRGGRMAEGDREHGIPGSRHGGARTDGYRLAVEGTEDSEARRQAVAVRVGRFVANFWPTVIHKRFRVSPVVNKVGCVSLFAKSETQTDLWLIRAPQTARLVLVRR